MSRIRTRASHATLLRLLPILLISTLVVSSASERVVRTINLLGDEKVARFSELSRTDYFRLLQVDGDYVIVGAADTMFNLTVQPEIGGGVGIYNQSQPYRWEADDATLDECQRKADPEECHNFVRIVAPHKATGELLICGTHAYKPKCRVVDRATLEQVRDFPGIGVVPYDPKANFTYVLDGQALFTATTSDFAGLDSLIYRRGIGQRSDEDDDIRTEKSNLNFLNSPQFVSSISTNRYVYFFYHELSSESDVLNNNPGTFSRVARVCKNDRGGPDVFRNEWTSFVKARLRCSIPGAKVFFFDHMVGTHFDPASDVLYATFVSEYEFLSHSVVCAFRISDIDQLFKVPVYLEKQRNGYRRVQRDSHALTGQCHNDSRALTQQQMTAVKSAPLIAEMVPNVFGRAVGVYQGADRYNHIAVLPASNPTSAGVIFVGTNQGNVLRLADVRNVPGATFEENDPLVKVGITKLADGAIRALRIVSERFLVAVTDAEVVAVSLWQCDVYATCQACVEARDPLCGWSSAEAKCAAFSSKTSKMIQNIATGNSSACPYVTVASRGSAIVPSAKNNISPNLTTSTRAESSKLAPQPESLPNCTCDGAQNLPTCDVCPVGGSIVLAWLSNNWTIVLCVIQPFLFVLFYLFCYRGRTSSSKAGLSPTLTSQTTNSSYITAYGDSKFIEPTRQPASLTKHIAMQSTDFTRPPTGARYMSPVTSEPEPFTQLEVMSESSTYMGYPPKPILYSGDLGYDSLSSSGSNGDSSVPPYPPPRTSHWHAP